jgi:pilus assembly protein FimV
LNKRSVLAGRFALTGVATAALMAFVSPSWALGLGRLQVQSALGEALRAEIEVTSLTPDESSSLRVKIAAPEAFRAAGVEFNAALANAEVVLRRKPDGRPYLAVSSDRSVQEPFVDVILELSWSTGRLVREYTMLLDPPTVARAPAQPTAPAIAAAPATATPVAPRSAAAPAPAPAAAPRAPAAAPAPAVTSAAAPAAAAGGDADSWRVRSGDTLSKIARSTQRPGVSLDQMLVSLFRANPQAFAGSNMNRLRAGVVLNVPSADEAKAVPPAEARQTIQAQSADFGAYRQRLAGAVPAAGAEASPQKAGGKIEGAAEDRKQTAAATPDRLTLSKGGAAAKPGSTEDTASKAAEQKAAAARQAELQKNVEDLKKLSAAVPKPGTGAGTGAAPAPAPAVAPTIVAQAPVAAPPAAPATPPAAAPAPATPPAPAAAPATAAAPTPASAPAATPAPAASTVVAAAPKPAAPPAPKPAPAAAPAAEEPGLLSALMNDNPLALAAGGALIALLAGFGIYRFSRRGKTDSGETSFLESRLQPDSFFGASGGQRVDTRDAGGNSSMSYSLSQLDAIGDVDPVAEADVYLAYGRDLQAEEILKEAMRSNPERMAIRTKLLEVYAKRRDTKGFELLATQLYALVKGQGDDWAKAQELGQKIDPDNALYQPGGAPAAVVDGGKEIAEPLGATTMPQSTRPAPDEYDDMPLRTTPPPSMPAPAPAGGVMDLDLDLDDPESGTPSSRMPLDAVPPVIPGAMPPAAAPLFDEPEPMPAHGFQQTMPSAPVPLPPPPAPAMRPVAAPVEFDLSGISLDLDLAPSRPAPLDNPPSVPPNSGLMDLGLPPLGENGADDPFARKLELAEEFRQIGDAEGARDLLQEVVANSSGALKAKAQGMLDELS